MRRCGFALGRWDKVGFELAQGVSTTLGQPHRAKLSHFSGFEGISGLYTANLRQFGPANEGVVGGCVWQCGRLREVVRLRVVVAVLVAGAWWRRWVHPQRTKLSHFPGVRGAIRFVHRKSETV